MLSIEYHFKVAKKTKEKKQKKMKKGSIEHVHWYTHAHTKNEYNCCFLDHSDIKESQNKLSKSQFWQIEIANRQQQHHYYDKQRDKKIIDLIASLR